jgi:hypothetical protein
VMSSANSQMRLIADRNALAEWAFAACRTEEQLFFSYGAARGVRLAFLQQQMLQFQMIIKGKITGRTR